MTYLGTLKGTNDAGAAVPLNATAEGHLEVEVHGPRLPFGAIHTEVLTPVFQVDGLYSLNPKLVVATEGRAIAGSGSGSTAVSGGNLVAKTGTTSYSFASIQSRRRMRYRPGQGVVGRCAGYFDAGVASYISVMGFGQAESGYYVGYNGTSFGILHSTGGVREIHTLTVSVASTATNDYQITLPNGDTVNVTATNNGSTARTAYEIAQGDFPGWQAEQVGSTVIFLANGAGASGGSFALAQPSAGTPAAGTDATTLAGVATTDTWIPQASWNGADILDGNGASGVTLDPEAGNVYEFGIQYLGYGTVEVKCEIAIAGNDPKVIILHTFFHPNTRTTPHVTNPVFPFTMAAYSAGSTTDLGVYVGSFAGFIEGEQKRIGPRMVYRHNSNGYVDTNLKPMFTVRNRLVYQGRANQNVVYLRTRNAAHDDATPIEFLLIRDAPLTGTPSFASFGDESCTTWDTAATGVSIPSTTSVEDSLPLAQNAGGEFPFDDNEITLQPGEQITFAAQAVTGTATYVKASLKTREDQ